MSYFIKFNEVKIYQTYSGDKCIYDHEEEQEVMIDANAIVCCDKLIIAGHEYYALNFVAGKDVHHYNITIDTYNKLKDFLNCKEIEWHK